MFLNALVKKFPQDSQTLYKHGLQSHGYIMLDYPKATPPHKIVKNISFHLNPNHEDGARNVLPFTPNRPHRYD